MNPRTSAKSLLLAVTIFAASLACSPSAARRPALQPQVRAGQACAPEGILFSVVLQDGQRVPGVEVSRVLREEGIQTLGRTDQGGGFCLPKAELDSESLLLLMFCARNFSCTAVVNDSNLEGLNEWPVVLSPQAVF